MKNFGLRTSLYDKDKQCLRIGDIVRINMSIEYDNLISKGYCLDGIICFRIGIVCRPEFYIDFIGENYEKLLKEFETLGNEKLKKAKVIFNFDSLQLIKRSKEEYVKKEYVKKVEIKEDGFDLVEL